MANAGLESKLIRRCVVLGGAGAVGSMMADLMAAAGAQVCAVDTQGSPPYAPPAVRLISGDATAPSAAVRGELATADAVVLALPEPAALRAVAPVSAAMRPGSLLVETLSVKARISAVLSDPARRLEVVGLNPMFAPSLGIAGRPVAAVVERGGPRTERLLASLEGAGARVVELTAEEHDRLASATQALTHAAVLAFGLALGELGVDLDAAGALAPPPHATMLALLARITGGTPEVYWDVQSANPYAAPARAALARGVERLAAAMEGPDEKAFTQALDETKVLLGPELEQRYGAVCASLFQTMRMVD